MAIDDGVADSGMAADIHVVVDDGILHFAEAIDAHVEADHGSLHTASGNDRAAADDGVQGHAHAVGISKNGFDRRVLLLPGAQRPAFIVEIEDRRHGNQVDIGFVVGVDGADVAPVKRAIAVFVLEIVGKDAIFREDAREDIAAEVVRGFGILGIGEQDGDQQLRVEDIYAHGGICFVRAVRGALGLRRLLLKAEHAPLSVGLDDAKTMGGFRGVGFDGGHGDVGAGIDVLLEHLAVVHLVDVIAGENDDVGGTLAADGINILVDGVGGAEIPAGGDAHLRRQNFDEVAESHQRRPAQANMTIQAQRLVLREDEDAAQIAIDTIG